MLLKVPMTAIQLLLYILLGVFAQVSIAALLGMYRHLRSYRHLQKRMSGLETKAMPEPKLKDFMPNISQNKAAPWKNDREFRVVRRVDEDEAESICSFYLQPTDGGDLPDYKPGQFLTFNLDIPNPKNGKIEPITRCYSLSDGPNQPYYRVSIKRAPAPKDQPQIPPGISSNYFHDHVHEGDVLRVRAPSGHFFLDPDTSPIVLIGGGVGITPMLSMLNATLNNNNDREIWLFYGVTNSLDHGMKAHFEEMALKHENFNLHVCYANPLAQDKLGRDYQHKGFIDLTLLRLQLSFQVYNFYICGPKPMMESLIPALEAWGVPDQMIHYESFGPASITRSSRKTEPEYDAQHVDISVTFSESNLTIPWDKNSISLLDFAEKNGISVQAGCRAGGCGCCQTQIEEGEVAYIQTPDFDVDQGSCLLCVSRPSQNLTVKA